MCLRNNECVALTGNWTIPYAIEVVMALVAWSRYTTVRHSTIETSGPPQEVRHTCPGVCVPILIHTSAEFSYPTVRYKYAAFGYDCFLAFLSKRSNADSENF